MIRPRCVHVPVIFSPSSGSCEHAGNFQASVFKPCAGGWPWVSVCPVSSFRSRECEMKSKVPMCGKHNVLRKPVLQCANFFSINSVILFRLLFLELHMCIGCLLSLRHSAWWFPIVVQKSSSEQRRKTIWVQTASCLTSLQPLSPLERRFVSRLLRWSTYCKKANHPNVLVSQCRWKLCLHYTAVS